MEIEINRVSKSIKGSQVLKDVTVHFTGGKVYGLKGKNGSGKTMLMRAVCGLIKPTDGAVSESFIEKIITLTFKILLTIVLTYCITYIV